MLCVVSELFNNREQHDAHEFLNYLVNTVDDLLRKPAKGAAVCCCWTCCPFESLPPVTCCQPRCVFLLCVDASEASAAQDKNKRTWVDDVFKGTLTNETKCLCCETVSHVTVTWLSHDCHVMWLYCLLLAGQNKR